MIRPMGDSSGGRKPPVKMLVVGAGLRGRIYASYALERPEQLQVVGVAEPRKFWRDVMIKTYGIKPENAFESWEEAASVPKFADCVVIATQDSMHHGPTIAFANLKYHILLEKPMAPTMQECIEMVDAVKANGVMFAVCHVLRYTPYNMKLKELIASKAIGDVVNVRHLEPVGFWHQVHSFVRGNWRNEKESVFMLMAKSCHDVDLIRDYVGSKCVAVSSFGSLHHFRKENKPENAGSRCLDCAVEEECIWSAKKMYLDAKDISLAESLPGLDPDTVKVSPSGSSWYAGNATASAGSKDWPLLALTDDPDVESVTKALRTGPYGKCVYETDNDVVDNQVVNFQFENGSTASFTMMAFTESMCVRKTEVFGTRGELIGNGVDEIVHFDFFSRKRITHRIDLNAGSECDRLIPT